MQVELLENRLARVCDRTTDLDFIDLVGRACSRQVQDQSANLVRVVNLQADKGRGIGETEVGQGREHFLLQREFLVECNRFAEFPNGVFQLGRFALGIDPTRHRAAFDFAKSGIGIATRKGLGQSTDQSLCIDSALPSQYHFAIADLGALIDFDAGAHRVGGGLDLNLRGRKALLAVSSDQFLFQEAG